MSDHLSIKDVERYRSRRLPTAELLAINAHLAACVTCRELFEEPRRLEATYSFAQAVLGDTGVESTPHLSYEQIAAYTDEQLSEQERSIVDIHLEGCRTYDAEVDDLQRTREGTFSRVSTTRSNPSLSNPAKKSGYSVPLQIAVMVAIAAVSSIITARLLQGSLARQEALLNEVRARSEELQRGFEEIKGAVAELQARLERIGELSGENGLGVRIALNDAQGTVMLNAQGALTGLESVEPRDERLIREALTTGRARTPTMLPRLIGKPRTTMGPPQDESFALLSPVATFVLTNRPTMRWEPLSGASGYVVTILDSSLSEVETSPQLTETEWKVSRPLRPSGVYMWQVRALKNGVEIRSPAPKRGEAKFKVLERSKALEVERMRQTYANSHLALGVIYAEAGLLEEANREFEALARANPDSRVVKSLIKSVKRSPAK